MSERKKQTFNFICYGGTMVKRVDLELTEQHYLCPYAGANDDFPACKTCNGEMEGIVKISVRFV